MLELVSLLHSLVYVSAYDELFIELSFIDSLLVAGGGLGVIGGDTTNFVGLGGCPPEGISSIK